MAFGGNEFTLPVEGIGDFTFQRRTVRLNVAIGVETRRLNEGVEVDANLAQFIDTMAVLKVLTIEAPKGWDIESLDAFDQDSYEQVMRVGGALAEREATFRKGTAPGSAAAGEGAGGDGGVLVSPQVSAGAD